MTVRSRTAKPWTSLTGLTGAGFDRLLHPWRRRRALARLRLEGWPRSVAFISKGDLHRGPFAAACLRGAIDESLAMQMRITSAGFIRPGRSLSPDARRCANRYSIDLDQHRSQLIAALDVSQWDLFVVADPAYGEALRCRYGLKVDRLLVLGDLDPWSVAQRAIPDPLGHSAEVLEACYERVQRCTHELVTALRRS